MSTNNKEFIGFSFNLDSKLPERLLPFIQSLSHEQRCVLSFHGIMGLISSGKKAQGLCLFKILGPDAYRRMLEALGARQDFGDDQLANMDPKQAQMS